MAKSVEMDYKKLSNTKMLNWLEENGKPDKEIAEFAQIALIEKDGEDIDNLKEAKKYFYEKYNGEIKFINAPDSKPKKESTIARLKKYRDLLK